MRHLSSTLKTRQGKNTLRRFSSLIARYGLNSAEMEAKISAFIKKAQKVTFPITVRLLRKHPSFFKEGAEYAVHGYSHADYSRMTWEKQERHLRKARQVMDKFGALDVGFRAPYLKTNKATLQLLSTLDFLYDSSCPIHWDILSAKRMNDQYRLALDHYESRDPREEASLPFIEEGILRIPVSLPDDEMLIDRLGIKSQDELYEIWSEILCQCHQRNEIFVLLLHPERFHLAEGALDRLMKEAKRRNMRIGTLREIVSWWTTPDLKERWHHERKGAFCITGDIDIGSLADLF